MAEDPMPRGAGKLIGSCWLQVLLPGVVTGLKEGGPPGRVQGQGTRPTEGSLSSSQKRESSPNCSAGTDFLFVKC